KMINQIQEDTGADISIEDDGTVYIGATDGPSAEAARAAVNAIANPQMPEVGERFLGTVVKTTTFGAFISLLPGKDGLLHISEIRKLVGGRRIDAVEDVLSVGQKVQVELKEIDPRGKLSLAAVVAEDAEGAGSDTAASGAEEVTTAAAEAEAPQLPGAETEAPVADAPASQDSGSPESDDSSDSADSDDSSGSAADGEGGDRPRRQRRRRGGRGRGGHRAGAGTGDAEGGSAAG